MHFYMLRHNGQQEADVYVNRHDFDEAVRNAIDEARHRTCGNVAAGEIERHVRAGTQTCASLNEVESMLPPDDGETAHWRETGRSHDGKRPNWYENDYRGGNAELYRQAAASLRTAGDETMDYDQGRCDDTGVAKALSVDHIAPESRVVTDEMAETIHPGETAGCAAGHVYVCAHGWRDYLNTCVRSTTGQNASAIAKQAAEELGISTLQQKTLFRAKPTLEDIENGFGIEPEDWPCSTAEAEAIDDRWEDDEHHAADLAVVLETLARRCDRVNAFVAAIDN